jgi:hypothetical protein
VNPKSGYFTMEVVMNTVGKVTVQPYPFKLDGLDPSPGEVNDAEDGNIL